MKKGMFVPIESKINENRLKTIHVIENEVECFGSFEEQYAALKGFRNELIKYIRWASPNRKLFWNKTTLIESGDVLDWHVSGYFAPLDFKRNSWGDKKRSPSEHVTVLSKALKKKATRLIYVALPCKGVVYPELAVSSDQYREGSSTAPQWRKMVREMLTSGVEVIDMFPIFQRYKAEFPLFSYEHNISPEAAELTARAIADYIKETTYMEMQLPPVFSACKNNMWYHAWQTNAPEYHVRLHRENCIKKDEMIYLPFGTDSNICIFGNCNLQAYLYRGSGIANNLACELQMDIDYLGKKLIFGTGTGAFCEETLKKCIQRDIAICISFPSGSFVRTSQVDRKIIKRFFQRGSLFGEWSSINLAGSD